MDNEEAVVICPVDPYVEDDYFKTIEALGNRAAESEAMDFRQPISYLFPAIIITMAGVLVFKIYKKGKGRIRFSCIL